MFLVLRSLYPNINFKTLNTVFNFVEKRIKKNQSFGCNLEKAKKQKKSREPTKKTFISPQQGKLRQNQIFIKIYKLS